MKASYPLLPFPSLKINHQYPSSGVLTTVPTLWGTDWDQLQNSVLFSHPVVSDSATPWTAARQASLSFIISRSLLKLMSIESVMSPNHLSLCRPLLLLPSIFPSISVLSRVSSSRQVARVLELHLQCKMKMHGSLLKNYYEFQGSDGRAVNPAWSLRTEGPEQPHRPCAREAGPGTTLSQIQKLTT